MSDFPRFSHLRKSADETTYLANLARYKNVTLNATAKPTRWKPENLKQKRLSQEEVQKIQELKEQGKTQREIAEEIGVNQNTVQHHLNKKENFPICSDPDSPSPTEPPNVIKAPVEFKRREPIQREVHIDLDDDEDEEDLDIEAPDDEKKVYRVVKKEPSLSGDHYIRYIPLQLGRI